MNFEILEWDSNFFGFKTAQVLSSKAEDLSDIIKQLKKNDVRLAYWFSKDKIDSKIISQFNGKLVDEKVTYEMELPLKINNTLSFIEDVEVCTDLIPGQDLEALAIESGRYSRFSVDTNIPREKFVTLYKEWIRNSLLKKIAKETLVIKAENKIVALATLGEKDNKASIGIIAVNEDYRGQSFAKKLIYASQNWFVKEGYKFCQVVTQQQNIPANKLYTKCGFSIAKIEYVYHFWI